LLLVSRNFRIEQQLQQKNKDLLTHEQALKVLAGASPQDMAQASSRIRKAFNRKTRAGLGLRVVATKAPTTTTSTQPIEELLGVQETLMVVITITCTDLLEDLKPDVYVHERFGKEATLKCYEPLKSFARASSRLILGFDEDSVSDMILL